jgi:N-acetylmuramoyl-L-alanine amidase
MNGKPIPYAGILYYFYKDKYMYGETSNYDEAKRLLSEAKSKGYSSAFLIAFKNGKKVSIQDALKQ